VAEGEQVGVKVGDDVAEGEREGDRVGVGVYVGRHWATIESRLSWLGQGSLGWPRFPHDTRSVYDLFPMSIRRKMGNTVVILAVQFEVMEAYDTSTSEKIIQSPQSRVR